MRQTIQGTVTSSWFRDAVLQFYISDIGKRRLFQQAFQEHISAWKKRATIARDLLEQVTELIPRHERETRKLPRRRKNKHIPYVT